MKTRKELNELKKEVREMEKKLAELTEEELSLITGGGFGGIESSPPDLLSEVYIVIPDDPEPPPQ